MTAVLTPDSRSSGPDPQPPTPDPQSPTPGPQALLLAVTLFVLALWPRLVGLDVFVTTDEIFWAGRSANFARALITGRLGDTFQTGHPGVTTMWVGLLGMGPERAQRLAGERREVSRRQVSGSPDFLPGLVAARHAVAIAAALAVAGVGLLARRLLGGGAALLGGALLALDPFFLAHSQLLHIDALLSSFMTLGLLAGLVRWLAGGGRGYLLLSAVATGLALLSKSPALFLVGFLPPVAGLAAWRRGRLLGRGLWADLLTWVGLVVLTYLLGWPALWAAPLETLRGVLEFIAGNANPRHAAIAEGGAESGLLFYPAAFALRSTPLAWIGLALLATEALATRRRGEGLHIAPSPFRPRSQVPVEPVGAPSALLAYALLFGLAMTVAAKSFDRYLLPTFPALDLLAGLGLALGARRLRWLRGAGRLLAGAFVLPLLVYPVGTSLPYNLAWYNPLAGGGPAAQRALAVGWGEGLDQVARYLNLKPSAERLKVAMPGEIYTTVLDAQFVGQVMPAEGGDPSASEAAYFVSYIRAQPDGPPFYDPRFQSWPPELVVRLADVEYARVYSVAVGVPLGATFGQAIRLAGYGLDRLVVRSGGALSVKLFWQALGPIPPQASVVLTLADAAGHEAARAEAPLGPIEPGPPRARAYALPVPAGLGPGEYLLWVGLDSAPGQPLPLAGPPAALAPGAPESPNRAVLRSLQVR